nr:hypothetical protein [Tanacetum cinerariifolium]
YRLNARYAIKECSSCGTLYTRDCCCSKRNVKDKILVPKLPKNCARCARCGHQIDSPYCQGCALLRKKLEEDLVTHFQDFQNTFESSDDSTNIVNAPREPFVVKQDHGSFVDKIICDLNKAPDSPHLHTFLPNQFHCFYYKDVLGDGWNRLAVYDDDDDDVDYTIAITPVLSTEEPDNSLKISSGSTTTHSDITLLDYEAFSFSNDHIEKISSGSTTTHYDISLSEYDSFIFDLSMISFLLRVTLLMRSSSVNSLTSYLHRIEDDHSPLLAYVVWIFLAYLMYPVIPHHLHSFRNKDTIFDPGIAINRFYSFKPGLSHRCGTFKKFNTHRSHLNDSLMKMLFSTFFPIDQ